LDKADGLRRKREKAIELTDTLLRAVFFDMFGDPVTNPKGFQMRTLKEFYADKKTGTKCGPFGSALKKDEYCKTGVPVWNMDNITKTGEFVPTQRLWITDEKFSALESYAVQNKDIIISRAGTVGKMCVVHTELSKSIISTNLIRLRLNENLSPEYFVCLMNYCKGRVGRLKTGPDGTFTHMNTGILDNLRFPYSPIKLQNEFIAVQDEFTKRSLKDQDYVKQASNLFSSLTQRAFSGELTG
jgi:type I restriction enzyme S subunit